MQSFTDQMLETLQGQISDRFLREPIEILGEDLFKRLFDNTDSIPVIINFLQCNWLYKQLAGYYLTAEGFLELNPEARIPPSFLNVIRVTDDTIVIGYYKVFNGEPTLQSHPIRIGASFEGFHTNLKRTITEMYATALREGDLWLLKALNLPD